MKIVKPLKNYDDEECIGCLIALKYKDLTKEQLKNDHNDCHGWHHCGENCCGPCSTCGE